MPKPFGVPWFIYDLDNKQLITSRTIPGDLSDSKEIILTETPVPGLNFAPIMPGGGGNRKVSLTIPVVQRRDPTFGNVAMVKQFDLLRNQVGNGLGVNIRQFNRMPKVLFYWGVGSVPLVYWVAKCDMTHKGEMVNAFGMPTYTEIALELILDETDPGYIAEEAFRGAQAWLGRIAGGTQAAIALLGGRPY